MLATLRVLLEWKGGDNAMDFTDLHSAASEGNLQKVRELVGCCPLDTLDECGKTALHYAVEHEHLDIATVLLDAGANVDAHKLDLIGDTPLASVAGNCSLATATLLIEAGADPTIRGWMQLCAIDRAKDRKRGDGPLVYQLLLNAASRR